MAAHELGLVFTSLCFETFGPPRGDGGSTKVQQCPTSAFPAFQHRSLAEEDPSSVQAFQAGPRRFRLSPFEVAFTDAADPELAKPETRLSDRALARILVDVTISIRSPRRWVGNLQTGSWYELCRNCRTRDQHFDILLDIKNGTYESPCSKSVELATPAAPRFVAPKALPQRFLP
ncbi:hypothetical protein GN244_ATG14112 [Phytophthora infestans]|uniref:Uncharacterized protein n=1 Tax=Phytophthora infestans TaxID=4787 RepID=A0A833W8L6_PHYIN|nr:hypothetical protein GN244_ATG14112 [Phytophthora infestans]KAF4145855.1 hypothetical protein GN958_ATG04965 [Phytophthora infestans]